MAPTTRVAACVGGQVGDRVQAVLGPHRRYAAAERGATATMPHGSPERAAAASV